MTPDKIRYALVELGSLASKTDRAAGEINKRALARREVVKARLAALRPRVSESVEAADEYQALVLERGRLDRVLSS